MIEGVLHNGREFTLTGEWRYVKEKDQLLFSAYISKYTWNPKSEMYDIEGADLVELADAALELATFHNQRA